MSSGEIEDVDEFDVDTSISDTAKKRRDDEVARREQAAAAEIDNIRGRVAVGTPPRGAPPARPARVNPLDVAPRPVRAASPSPLAEAFKRNVRSTATPSASAPDKKPEVRRPPRRPVGSNPLDARADASASDSALRRSPTDSSAGVGFEDELFNTEINQLLSGVDDVGTAPVESTIDFEESRSRRPSASGAIAPIAGATTQLRRGVSGWVLPLLLLTAAALIGWFSGLLPDLITTLLE